MIYTNFSTFRQNLARFLTSAKQGSLIVITWEWDKSKPNETKPRQFLLVAIDPKVQDEDAVKHSALVRLLK